MFSLYIEKAQVFTIFISDLEFFVATKTKPKINPESIVLEELYNFLDMFLKKDSDTFLSHKKYDYKIILEIKQKYNHTLL